MKRVSVIGCPGAGKTEFSKLLSDITHLPLVHIDRIYYDTDFAYETDKESWRAKMKEVVTAETWLIDGNYKSTFDIRLPVSDTIIFLDYPTYICVWRAVKRRIRFHKRVRTDMPETWRERLSWNFFLFIVRFNRAVAVNMRKQLKEYGDSKKIIVLTSPRHAENFLNDLSSAV